MLHPYPSPYHSSSNTFHPVAHRTTPLRLSTYTCSVYSSLYPPKPSSRLHLPDLHVVLPVEADSDAAGSGRKRRRATVITRSIDLFPFCSSPSYLPYCLISPSHRALPVLPHMYGRPSPQPVPVLPCLNLNMTPILFIEPNSFDPTLSPLLSALLCSVLRYSPHRTSTLRWTM
jgi:hypothetical protein